MLFYQFCNNPNNGTQINNIFIDKPNEYEKTLVLIHNNIEPSPIQ